MKSIVERKEEEQGIKFPCLMIANDGMVILATSYKQSPDYDSKTLIGTLMSTGGKSSLSIGAYSKHWALVCFKPLEKDSRVTLIQE